jgi:hypothetical protein
MIDVEVWHANDIDAAKWFANACNRAVPGTYQFNFATIPAAGSAAFLRLSETFQRLLRLDKPDLVATYTQGGLATPIVSLEITATTPHGQHGKQRFARLAAAAELQIPAIYIIPFEKLAEVKGRPQIYPLGGDVPYGLQRLTKVTDCPATCFPFPSSGGELLKDSKHPGQPDSNSPEMGDCFRLVAEYLAVAKHRRQISASKCPKIVERAIESTAALAKEPIISHYKTLELIKTVDLEKYLASKLDLSTSWIRKSIAGFPPRFATRPETLIFKPDGRMFEKAGDPYCGMFSWIDYSFCRTGRNPQQRFRNLIYMPMKGGRCRSMADNFARDGYSKFWQQGSSLRLPRPEKVEQQFGISHELRYGGIFLMIKPLRIYGYLADLIVFRDAVLPF